MEKFFPKEIRNLEFVIINENEILIKLEGNFLSEIFHDFIQKMNILEDLMEKYPKHMFMLSLIK